ncbi:MAG: type I-A CRISPR-associated protein Cas7/Csa2 [Aigarchaeota archaeon]|nr:type I-A CRISPR-associated protein Cas7/Csa2 [Aigarchaeota archaeon]
MVYLRITGRAIVNVHSANAEGAVGNYMALSKMFIIRRTGDGYDISEEPVISGNMLKHWHAVNMVDILKSSGYEKICPYCARHVMYRSPDKTKKDEVEFVGGCAIEDVHGFLQPDVQVRRDSLMKFSFMLPVEDAKTEYEAVTHNRVVIEESGKIPAEEQAMMVFKREHASGIYGFLISGDLAYTGRPLADPDNKNKWLPLEERKMRVNAAATALINLLSGRFGAAASRAMPVVKLSEIIIAISRQPIPNLVHGFYYDYAEESAKILEAALGSGLTKELKVYISGEKPSRLVRSEVLSKVVEQFASPMDALTKSAEVIRDWLR